MIPERQPAITSYRILLWNSQCVRQSVRTQMAFRRKMSMNTVPALWVLVKENALRRTDWQELLELIELGSGVRYDMASRVTVHSLRALEAVQPTRAEQLTPAPSRSRFKPEQLARFLLLK